MESDLTQVSQWVDSGAIALDAYSKWNGIKLPQKYGFAMGFASQAFEDAGRDDLNLAQRGARATAVGVESLFISPAASGVGNGLGMSALYASLPLAVDTGQLWLPPVAYRAGYGVGYGVTYAAGVTLAQAANEYVFFPLADLLK